ncbi:hypothetical protein Scep_026127 [Stephania cephalantha]|uniref:Uncharacterized protein n=1 Tax=Stephania cephalantha TaxID=152367 RepID=A0AAP0ERS4_9MAGN
MFGYAILKCLENDNGSHDMKCGNLVLNIIGITWMIDVRADYRFTEPVDILLTLLFSQGTSTIAIGLQKGRHRKDMRPSQLHVNMVVFILSISYLTMCNMGVDSGI